MKNYNKFSRYIFLIFIALNFCSCTKEYLIKETFVLKIENQINESLFITIKTNINEGNTHLVGFQTDSILWETEQIIEEEFSYISRLRLITIDDYMIFNINDTTSIISTQLNNEEISFLVEKIYVHSIDVHTRFSTTKRETLTIDSTLLPIFKKDYGMLELFSEYYE